MRRLLFHKMLLLGLLLISLAGMARTGYARYTAIRTADKTQHLSNDQSTPGEIEIAAPNQLTGTGYRSHVKNGSDPSALPNNNWFTYLNAKPSPLGNSIEESRSGHLLLIFPFHYFW